MQVFTIFGEIIADITLLGANNLKKPHFSGGQLLIGAARLIPLFGGEDSKNKVRRQIIIVGFI